MIQTLNTETAERRQNNGGNARRSRHTFPPPPPPLPTTPTVYHPPSPPSLSSRAPLPEPPLAKSPLHSRHDSPNHHWQTVADPVQEEHPTTTPLPAPPLLLKVKRLSPNAVLPSRGSAHAAGYDLSSAVETVVPARGRALVATDLSLAVPEGTYARIAPRSGLALKHGMDVGAGVVDADYRAPVGVLLFNHSDADFAVRPGDHAGGGRGRRPRGHRQGSGWVRLHRRLI